MGRESYTREKEGMYNNCGNIEKISLRKIFYKLYKITMYVYMNYITWGYNASAKRHRLTKTKSHISRHGESTCQLLVNGILENPKTVHAAANFSCFLAKLEGNIVFLKKTETSYSRISNHSVNLVLEGWFSWYQKLLSKQLR